MTATNFPSPFSACIHLCSSGIPQIYVVFTAPASTACNAAILQAIELDLTKYSDTSFKNMEFLSSSRFWGVSYSTILPAIQQEYKIVSSNKKQCKGLPNLVIPNMPIPKIAHVLNKMMKHNLTYIGFFFYWSYFLKNIFLVVGSM
jgi:hypothetical protein